MRAIEGDDRNICLRAFGERASLSFKPKAACAAERCGQKCCLGIQTLHRFSVSCTRHQKGEACFFEHVASVVARNGVAAETDPDVLLQKSGERCAPVSELGIRLWAMRDARIRRLNRFYIFAVNRHAMREQWPRAQEAVTLQVLNGRDAGRAPLDSAPRETFGKWAASLKHEERFSFRFSHVHHQRQACARCEFRNQLKLRRAHGVWRVRRNTYPHKISLIFTQPRYFLTQRLKLFARLKRIRSERFLVNNPAQADIPERTHA